MCRTSFVLQCPMLLHLRSLNQSHSQLQSLSTVLEYYYFVTEISEKIERRPNLYRGHFQSQENRTQRSIYI